MSANRQPRVLVVYYSLTKQSARVADAIMEALSASGCDATKAPIEFTDDRWLPKLSEFPMSRPFPQIASILWAQLRHKTGAIVIPPAAERGGYDLVVLASPTWWFQTSMPIRSYLEVAGREKPPRRHALCVCVDLAALLQHQPPPAEEPCREGRWPMDREDAFRRRGRPGQVDALLARLHEARRTAGARGRSEDASTEPEAGLRGSVPRIRPRAPRRAVPAARGGRRGIRRSR